jgi:hypothetical protein
MHDLEIVLGKKIEKFRHEKDKLVAEKDKLRIKQMIIQKAEDGYVKELKRIKGHKMELVDTDVWIAGVLQRMHTKEFRVHLKTALKAERKKNEDVHAQLEKIRQEIIECTDRLNKLKRDCDKITVADVAFRKCYAHFTANAAEAQSQDLVNSQVAAMKVENRRTKDKDHEQMTIILNAQSLIDKVRVKTSELRTKQERQFVGIDIVIHPEAYAHISLIEAEQMQFDKDYQCNLAKSDLERIEKLPEQVFTIVVSLSLYFTFKLSSIYLFWNVRSISRSDQLGIAFSAHL